jgi:sec-independent protein translocase protein TatC
VDSRLSLEKFSPFLAEARKRILFTLSVFILATIVGFAFYEPIIKFLIQLLTLEGTNIVFTSPFQFINLAISSGLATGLVVTMPLIIIQVLSFLRPALRKREFRMVTRFLPFSGILFLVGFVFGALIMKWQIDIFLSRAASLGIGNVLDISQLLSVVLLTAALMGIGFQFPIVLLVLLRLGIISHSQLSRKRKWVYLAAFILTMFLPPDSILADIILSMPFIFSFEATLLIHRIMERKKAKN